MLGAPTLRRFHAKLTYEHEWAASIAESHPPSPERDAAIRRHHEECELIRTALAAYLRKEGLPETDPEALARAAGYPLSGAARDANTGLVAWF